MGKKYEIWCTSEHDFAIAADQIKSRTPRNSAITFVNVPVTEINRLQEELPSAVKIEDFLRMKGIEYAYCACKYNNVAYDVYYEYGKFYPSDRLPRVDVAEINGTWCARPEDAYEVELLGEIDREGDGYVRHEGGRETAYRMTGGNYLLVDDVNNHVRIADISLK